MQPSAFYLGIRQSAELRIATTVCAAIPPPGLEGGRRHSNDAGDGESKYRVQWDFVRKVDRMATSDTSGRMYARQCRAPKLELAGMEAELVLPRLASGRYELIAETEQGIRTRMAFGIGGARAAASSNKRLVICDRRSATPWRTARSHGDVVWEGYLYVAVSEQRYG